MNWLKRQGWWFVIVVFWVVISLRIEPFKSNFVLALIGALLVGLAGGLVEFAILKVRARRRSLNSPPL